MKNILKQLGWAIVALMSLTVQLVSLVFAIIGQVFDKLAELLSDVSYKAVEKYPMPHQEEDSEEVPEEGMTTEGDLA